MERMPEELYAEEAREEAILARSESLQPNAPDQTTTSKPNTRVAEDEEALNPSDERSPLISSPRQGYDRSRNSYERAINEPWTGAHGAGSDPWYKRPSILWLLPAFFPFCVAFGGIIVPKQYLVIDLICRDYLSERAAHDPTFHYLPVILAGDNPQCQDEEVSSRTAFFNAYIGLITGFLSAIVTPHLGALSDRIGRKPVIVIGSFGLLATEIVTILVGTYPDRVTRYWLFLGAAMDGISGSFTTGMALSFAYASDCTEPKKRAVAFGYFQAVLFSGIALGPIVAGLLIKLAHNIMAVFWFALACHIFYILFTVFFVPESLSKERQLRAREKRAKEKLATANQGWLQTVRAYNPFEPLWVLSPRGAGASQALRTNLYVLAAVDTMMFGVAMGTMSVILIYVKQRFQWTAVDSSLYMSATNVFRVSALLLLLPLLNRMFRSPAARRETQHRGSDMLDIGIIRFAIVFDFLGYLGYALTPSGAFMVLFGIVASLGGVGSPTLQSALTKHMPVDRTGQILGAVGLLHALARVVAPVLFNVIFGYTVKVFAGTVFLCLASVFIIVFILSWFLKPNVYFDDTMGEETATQESEAGDETAQPQPPT